MIILLSVSNILVIFEITFRYSKDDPDGTEVCYSFLIFFSFYSFWVKNWKKLKKKCLVRFRFLHKFSKAVNGFFYSRQCVGRIIFQKKRSNIPHSYHSKGSKGS